MNIVLTVSAYMKMVAVIFGVMGINLVLWHLYLERRFPVKSTAKKSNAKKVHLK